MTFIVFFFIGTIIGALFVILALALCRMSARCSAREQAVMDDEQAAEVGEWEYQNPLNRDAGWVEPIEKWQAGLNDMGGEK